MSADAGSDRLIELGFEAFNAGDAERVTAILHPEVEAHVHPMLANAGTWHGVDGFVGMLKEWNEAFASQANTVVAVTHPDERHSIAEVHQRAIGAGSGAPVEMTVYYLFELRDGLVFRLHIYGDEQDALAALPAEGRDDAPAA